MKNNIISYALVVFALLSWHEPHAQISNSDTVKIVHLTQYTCSMHPEILSDSPGNCPKCGMQLVEKSKVSYEKNMGKMNHGMMGGMNNNERKRKFPMVLIMGVMMAIMMVLVVAKK